MAKSYMHTKKKKEYAAVEIEKLKAEIWTIPQVHIKTGAMSLDKELVVPLNKVIEKLDNRIKELKGEQKHNEHY